jgi:hypothetical protein
LSPTVFKFSLGNTARLLNLNRKFSRRISKKVVTIILWEEKWEKRWQSKGMLALFVIFKSFYKKYMHALFLQLR